MQIVLIGLSHRTAPVSVREGFAFSREELPGALATMVREVGNGVILSTCNRTEVYYTAGGAQASRDRAVQVLALLKGPIAAETAQCLYFKLDEEAVRHLHRVAAGLDSMVLGEAEILGQVRSAFAAACDAGASSSLLSRLFHSAIQAGRRCHAEMEISRLPASVSSAAVELSRSVLGDLSLRSALVIGGGEAGKLAGRSLVRMGIGRILVTSRDEERARQIARELGGEPIPFQRLHKALEAVDVAISSSGAATTVIDKRAVAAAMARRNGRGLLLMDIAVPRNIDPAVAEVDGVTLYDIDVLQGVGRESGLSAGSALARAEAIVEERVAGFLEWWRNQAVVSTVAALCRQAEELRQREVARTLRRFPELTPACRQGIDALTAALVRKILHRPIMRLRQGWADEEYLALVRELFGLDTGMGEDKGRGHRP